MSEPGEFKKGDRVRFTGVHAPGELGTVIGHASGLPLTRPDREEVLDWWDSEMPRKRGAVKTRFIELVEEEHGSGRFQIGDRVQVIESSHRSLSQFGPLPSGIITELGGPYIEVLLDTEFQRSPYVMKGNDHWYMWEDELELESELQDSDPELDALLRGES